MIRMTVTLAVAIYIVLIVVPGEDHGDQVSVTRAEGTNWLVAMITSAEETAQRPRPAPANAREFRTRLTDVLTPQGDGYVMQTADGETLEIAAIIDPADLLPDEQARASRVIWRVAGSNVNFRAGPSTNTAVLTGLVRGDQVEFISDAADGWAYLRVLDSGLEGYMAARFLEPVN
jgi:uncharacterized protein YgiM (DUF1202 family)